MASSIDPNLQSWLPEQDQREHPTRFRRGLIDPHLARSKEDREKALIDANQTFQLCVGLRDASISFFFIVPEPWRISTR